MTSHARAADRPLTIGMLGTFPPTRCGIATFTRSLATSMCPPGSGQHAKVVRSVEAPIGVGRPPEIVAELVQGSSASRAEAAEILDGCDVVVVQHEFGIYGGPDGDEVVDLLERISRPVIAVLHTVAAALTPGQRQVLEELTAQSAAVVVQSAAARERLLDVLAVEPELVHLIPHGAVPNLSEAPALSGRGGRPTVLTWGLLGPGKGIEFGIEAMALLGDLVPQPRYVVVGQTHPKVREAEGERYRASLLAQARERCLEDRVELDDTYYDTAGLLAKVREADIVLLPYESRDQVVSGVLVEAIASSTPVVATGFPHARELLASGAGTIVPRRDPAAIADAVRALCTDPAAAARAISAARRIAPALHWETVGRSYRSLAAAVSERHEVAA